MDWNVFVKVFVDHDNANNRRREKEGTLSGCSGQALRSCVRRGNNVKRLAQRR